jgi:(R,R)-butanediol dehydrogenase / meso-butanediol dehydrogenase / diacetyl reductase
MSSLSETMRAARWHGRHDVRVEEVPVPEPQPDQALIEVEWCGICGTDLEEYNDGPVSIPVGEPHPLTGRKAPLTLGHEIVGCVVKPARDGSGPLEGARVIPDVVLGCGECYWCRRHQEGLCVGHAVVGLHTDGGLAEYVASTARTCVLVPDTLEADVATLAEPTSVAARPQQGATPRRVESARDRRGYYQPTGRAGRPGLGFRQHRRRGYERAAPRPRVKARCGLRPRPRGT